MGMNKEIKQKWVTALRSGEYEQCEGSLWDMESGFCCLGVLSDIRRKELKKGREVFFESIYKLTNGVALLSIPIATWADFPNKNLSREDNSVDVRIGNKKLSVLNDDGMNFNQIADIIEENL